MQNIKFLRRQPVRVVNFKSASMCDYGFKYISRVESFE